jgi:hypothetical protein
MTATHIQSATMTAKLRAALDYLGDRLVTHRASRFKPAAHSLLDEWLATRRGHGAAPAIAARYEIQLSKADVVVQRIGGAKLIDLAMAVGRKRST